MSAPAFLDEITLEQLEADPYPTYARLREEAPVAWIPAAGVWFITGFDDCAALGSGEHGTTGATAHPTLQRVFGAPNVLTSSGEQHDDLRRGIDPKLQPRPVLDMVESVLRPIARRHARALVGTTGAELMSAYFEPVSVESLRHVMGLEDLVDTDTLRRWFHDLNGGIANFGLDPEPFAVTDRATREIEAVIRPRLAELAQRPDDSMLSHMLWAGREGGEPRSVETLLPSLKVLLLGGMQEPGHAAGSTMLGLFQHPEELEKLRAAPESFIPQAVHEGMRWIAPIGSVERQTTRDITLHGVTIPADSIIQIVLGSANRDERRFPEPDRFIMERGERGHQAFGNGEHFCAGHFFARQVQHVMFEELFRAVPDIEFDDSRPLSVTGWVFRAPKILHAKWSRREPEPEPAPAIARFQAGSADAGDGPALLEASVAAMRLEARGVLSLELRAAGGGELPAWRPGDHVEFHVGDGVFRQYSLSGDPADRLRYRIAVLREEHGRGVSRRIHDEVRPGDTVRISEPLGNFPLALDRPAVLVAGGIGVTPLIPMAVAARAAGRLVALHYCGRSAQAMAFREEVASLGGELHVSDEGSRAELGDLVSLAAAADARIYACGPERMLDHLAELGKQRGVEVAVEHFTGVEAHREGDRAFELVLSRSGRSVTVEADRTALEAVESLGAGTRSSCREGNCGSCEVRVLSGRVEHRDLLLTEAQRAANDRMMLCVSRALDDEIVIDL